MKILNRIRGNKSLLNGSLYSMFSFINQGVGFVLLILLAGYIAPEEYGHLSLFNTIVTFLGFLIALSSQGYLGVSYFRRKGELFKQDVTSISLIIVTTTIVFSSILLIAHGPISRITSIPEPYLWIAIVIAFFTVFNHMILDYFRIQEKLVKYGLISCSFAILNFVLSLYLVIHEQMSWSGRVYAHLACSLFFGGLGIVLFAKDKLFTHKVTWAGTMAVIMWGLPLIPHNAAGWLKQGCDRLIINGVHSVADVGIFSFALNLVNVIIIVGQAFNATYSVSVYKILSNDKSGESKRVLLKREKRNIFYIYLITTVLVMVGVPLTVPFLLPKYTTAIPYFMILSVYGFLKCLYFLDVNYLFFFNKNKYIMYITFASAILHLSLSLLLTRYSLYFTCLIYVLTQTIILIMIKSFSKKALAENNI